MRLSLAYSILIASSIQLLALDINGQTIDKELVTIELQNDNLVAMVKKIEAQSTLRFIYLPEQLSKYGNVSLVRGKRSVKETLDLVLSGTALKYEESGKYVVLKERVEAAAAPMAVDREPIASVVSGVVKDQDGLTLAGVSVMVKGTARGTTTDIDGRYAIEVNTMDDILIFSFIGFKPMEVKVGGQSDIKVTLESDVTSLKEVQVVGTTYWQTTKEMSVMNVAKVDSKDIENQPVTNPLMSLQGRMAGVDITPVNGVPGGAIKIQIRGTNSLRPDGGNPLYIIDGVPVDSRPIPSASYNTLLNGGFDPLSNINPANIESIEVLKDGAATAIYGSRGANGVVRITTKKSNKSGTSFDASVYAGVGQVSHTLDVLNTQQYLAMRRDAYKNDGLDLTEPAANDLLVWDTTRYTDWQKELLGGTAKITDFQGNLSGGSANTTFRLGGAYHNETMVFPGNFGLNRVNGQFSLDHHSSNNKLAITLSLNYGLVSSKVFDDSNLVSNAISLPPNAPALYDENGELNWENDSAGIPTWSNPLSVTRKVDNATLGTLIANSTIGYQLLQGLNLRANIGYTDMNGNEIIKTPINSNAPIYINQYTTGQSRFGNTKRNVWIIEPQLIYSKSIGNHNFDVILGSTIQKSQNLIQMIDGSGYSSDASLGSLTGAAVVQVSQDERTDYRYLAFFGRVAYNFKEKYILEATGRRDGSSRFAPGNQYGNFGGLGAAWIFTKESFMNLLKPVISFGKIRGSIASTGNDQVGDYQYYNTYSRTYNTYAGSASLHPTALYNSNFGWEKTTKIEGAIELRLLNDRVSFEAAYYRNRSSNQLVDYQLPGTTGFTSIFRNFNATVENRGWEFSVGTENVVSDKWEWITSFNISIPTNRLIAFPGIETSSYSQLYQVGQPLSISYVYEWTGVDPATGNHTFKDVNNNGYLDNDDKHFANINLRKYTGGLNNTIKFTNFELSFLIQYVKQTSSKYLPAQLGINQNQDVNILSYWRKEGDISNFSKPTTNSFDYDYQSQSDYMSTDASFLRLKTASFAYSLPSSLLSKIRITAAKIFIQGQNLFTKTNYINLDPDTGSALPPLRMLTMGAQFKL